MYYLKIFDNENYYYKDVYFEEKIKKNYKRSF